MTMTKERKVLFAVLGLGVAVFLVDRVFLSAAGPADASGGTQAIIVNARPNDPAAPSRTAGSTWSLPKPNEQSIAQRLSRYAKAAKLEPTQVREAFVPSSTWVPLAVETPSTTPATPALDARQAFAERHRLSGVLGSGASALANVDDVALRIGQTYDGFTLVEVTQRTAVFESPAGRVELRIWP